MLFNSAHFLVFFPLVLVAFFLFPRRFQWGLLLATSCYFYMAFVPQYILILFFLIIVDYILGRVIEQREGKSRKLLLIVSCLTNLGTLFVFKYFNFFNENVALLADFLGWNYSIAALEILLPLGLSFHVFQSLSYVIEVYRKKHPAERHLGIYALYVMFFPQLVAGPIERPQHLLPQLHKEQVFDYERVMDGLTLMLWGFFKKLVIADQLAVVVDRVYGNIDNMPSAAVLIAAVFFSYQIYCDFSGYSDIARGAARVLGIDLTSNFNRPYASRSIAEFWRRWHISLSSWIRDYVYIPLGGNRASKLRHISNLLTTFLLCGLWHGANWTFVFWGALHGTYLAFGTLTGSARLRLRQYFSSLRIVPAFQVLSTFTLVTCGWIFFRAPTFQDAWLILARLPEGFLQLFDWSFMKGEVLDATILGVGAAFIFLRIAAIVFMEVVEFSTASYSSPRAMLLRLPFAVRLSTYYFIALWIFLLGSVSARTFIYFQF